MNCEQRINADILEIVLKSSELNSEFDSHAVIRILMRRFPQEYTQDLNSYVQSQDPIRALHAEIGKRLAKLDFISAIGETTTVNIRGESTKNMKWRRL